MAQPGWVVIAWAHHPPRPDKTIYLHRSFCRPPLQGGNFTSVQLKPSTKFLRSDWHCRSVSKRASGMAGSRESKVRSPETVVGKSERPEVRKKSGVECRSCEAPTKLLRSRRHCRSVSKRASGMAFSGHGGESNPEKRRKLSL
jgi:hypothetical protein